MFGNLWWQTFIYYSVFLIVLSSTMHTCEIYDCSNWCKLAATFIALTLKLAVTFIALTL